MIKVTLRQTKIPGCACCLLWLLVCCITNLAERLPARTYTIADGLISNIVTRIVPDAKGFIWFCTLEGLSRFDGYSFTNYTTDDGLPDRHVSDLLITRDGVYWLATDKGLVRFNPKGNRHSSKDASPGAAVPMFEVHSLGTSKQNMVNLLFEDKNGRVWVGTSAGLFYLAAQDGQVKFASVALIPNSQLTTINVAAICAGPDDTLWIGTDSGLFHLWPDGHVEHYSKQEGLPLDDIRALLSDRQGRVWAGTASGGGLLLLSSEPSPAHSPLIRFYSKPDGLPADWVMSLFQSGDGRVLAGTPYGLAQFRENRGKETSSFRLYNDQQGLCGRDYYALGEDRDGDLWVATRCGVTKIARYGFTQYNQADGLDSVSINSIFENQAHELFVSTNEQWRTVSRFDGDRFSTVKFALPVPTGAYSGWGWKQTVLEDHLGDWWIPHGVGLFRIARQVRFDQLSRALAQPVPIETKGVEVFRTYEDAHGDIWVVTVGNAAELLRWERATGNWHDYTQAAGISLDRVGTAFCEDRSGNLWIATGGTDNALLQYRNGKFKVLTHQDGVPKGWLKDLYLDHLGRLWMASNLDGLFRIDDTTAEHPNFVAYTTSNGLSSNNVLCVTEDNSGRIYAGTGRSLDRLDPNTGQIKHYSSANGLPNGRIEEAYRDSQGALWFGATVGLARLIPEPERPSQPPLILITGLRVAGLDRPVSALGETDLSPLELAPTETHVSVDFLGLGASLGEELRYEYKLEGTRSDWTPTTERTVNFANLAPGTYRLLVRAVNADGIYSPQPAVVSLHLQAPVWRRSWFIVLCALALSAVAYLVYRYRVARLLEFANMRTRIATDLHDDIGSGLSRVAILSEVVKQQTSASAPQAEPMLTEIADSARVLVDSMRDIVWAIDPRHDDLASLIYRVRQFTSDVLEPRTITFDLPAPGELERIKLDPEQRRHIYLIFKEAINNVARHANCKSISFRVYVEASQLRAELRDDGQGFIVNTHSSSNGGSGHGLENMRRRISELNGKLLLESTPGQGTNLRISVPLKTR